MMHVVAVKVVVTASVMMTLTTASASAQVIGTFRWQFAPYCNVVTLTVEQVGAGFRVEGSDDLCGAAKSAGASGTAHLNPDGTIGFTLLVTRPDGLTVASAASLSLATISGTWNDEYGNTGNLAFNPPNPASGAPRRITLRGRVAMGHQQPTPTAGLSIAPLSFGATLAAPPAVNLLGVGDAPTTNCPGTVADPEALPGQLCIYLSARQNVSLISVLDLNGSEGADRSGASLLIVSSMTDPAILYGRWAVTVP